MINKEIQPYLPKIFKILEKHKIKNAYLFGSVLSDKFNEQSDIDLLVNFIDYSKHLEVGQSIWDLEDELEALTNHKIDLLTERSLKNPYLIQELNNTKQLIYEYGGVKTAV